MKLSPAVKAEILGGILHELADHMPKIWLKLPKKYQKLVRRGLRDCSIDMDKLSEKNFRRIREWFDAKP